MAASVDSDTRRNTVDPERLATEIAKIEDAVAAFENFKWGYVQDCKPYKETIRTQYEVASKAADVPISVLKAIIKQRDLQKKIEAIPEDLEEQRDTYEMVVEALGEFGDLPLGQAAKDRAAKAQTTSEVADKPKRGRPRKAPSAAAADPEPNEPDVRGNAQKLAEKDRDEEADRVAAENAERLGAGISPLH